MDIKSIETLDTHGVLSEPTYKINKDESAISAVFKNDEKFSSRSVFIRPSNIDHNMVESPLNEVTFLQVLEYNGTLDTNTKTFKQMLEFKISEGVGADVPYLEYMPGESTRLVADETIEDVVVDIAMHSGMADVLQYSEGVLSQGGKSYYVKAKHSYPTIITRFPNSDSLTTFLDGWYSYVYVRMQDIIFGMQVIKGYYSSYRGMIFKASHGGYIDIFKDEIFIRYTLTGEETAEVAISKKDWQDFRMNIQSRDGVGSNYNHAFVESQMLITDEIRDSILQEILCEAKSCILNTCAVTDWQRLTMARQAAYVMFENKLFRNAQQIIESTRKMCNTGSGC